MALSEKRALRVAPEVRAASRFMRVRFATSRLVLSYFAEIENVNSRPFIISGISASEFLRARCAHGKREKGRRKYNLAASYPFAETSYDVVLFADVRVNLRDLLDDLLLRHRRGSGDGGGRTWGTLRRRSGPGTREVRAWENLVRWRTRRMWGEVVAAYSHPRASSAGGPRVEQLFFIRPLTRQYVPVFTELTPVARATASIPPTVAYRATSHGYQRDVVGRRATVRRDHPLEIQDTLVSYAPYEKIHNYIRMP